MKEVKLSNPKLEYMPITFSGVLEFVLEKTKRKRIKEAITDFEHIKVVRNDIEKDIDKYCNLFS